MKKLPILLSLLALFTLALSTHAGQSAGSDPHRVQIPSNDPAQPEAICIGTFSCTSGGGVDNFDYAGDCNLSDVLELIEISYNTCGGTLD